MLILQEGVVDKPEDKSVAVPLTGSAKKINKALYNTAVVPLETVLTLLAGLCSDCQDTVRKELAKEAFHAAPPPRPEDIPTRMREIMERVAYDYEISIDTLIRGGNSRRFVQARREFAIEARRLGFSFPQIGKVLGKHHTTILYLVQSQ